MSYLSRPAISFVLYKVAYWDGQDQTHIFLVFSTQSGVKQHKGLVRLQEAQSAQKGRGGEGRGVEGGEGKRRGNEWKGGVMGLRERGRT